MRRHRTVRKAATLARSQIAESTRLAAEYDFDANAEAEPVRKVARMPGIDRPRPISIEAPEWYIAVDFGTTFTTVAWHRRGDPVQRIHTIDDFPGEKQHNVTRRQIPTEIWYPKKSGHPSGQVKAKDIRMRFGNEVHRLADDDEGFDLRKAYDDTHRITMMKLLLDKSEYAQISKDRLQEALEVIKSEGHVDENEDVFLHFFREVFRATSASLGPDFKDDSTGLISYQPQELLLIPASGGDFLCPSMLRPFCRHSLRRPDGTRDEGSTLRHGWRISLSPVCCT